MTAGEIIQFLGMQPLPHEGGYFAVTHTADEQLPAQALPSRYSGLRDLSGAIYYLETVEQFSAMHKLPTDELYYFHMGDPLEMLFLDEQGQGARKVLGLQLHQGQCPQILAPRHCWQGSRPLPGGPLGFTLVSTSMAPGYHMDDPVFGDRKELMKLYPKFKELIRDLTRTKPIN